jgi:hypothetical protein
MNENGSSRDGRSGKERGFRGEKVKPRVLDGESENDEPVNGNDGHGAGEGQEPPIEQHPTKRPTAKVPSDNDEPVHGDEDQPMDAQRPHHGPDSNPQFNAASVSGRPQPVAHVPDKGNSVPKNPSSHIHPGSRDADAHFSRPAAANGDKTDVAESELARKRRNPEWSITINFTPLSFLFFIASLGFLGVVVLKIWPRRPDAQADQPLLIVDEFY